MTATSAFAVPDRVARFAGEPDADGNRRVQAGNIEHVFFDTDRGFVYTVYSEEDDEWVENIPEGELRRWPRFRKD